MSHMSDDDLDRLLKNYTDLLARVDAHIRQVEQDHADKIACKKGCDACCRPLNLFPVEALALARAFSALPQNAQQRLRQKIIARQDQVESRDSSGCPLLMDHACLLYQARPVICRTHGFPIYMVKDGEALVDYCPENFKGMAHLPKEALLDLDQLNTLLTAINQHFITAIEADLPQRIPILEALFLLDDVND